MAIAAHSGRVTGRDTENICPVQEPVRLTEGEGQPQGNASRSMCSANRKKFLTPQLTSRIASATHSQTGVRQNGYRPTGGIRASMAKRAPM